MEAPLTEESTFQVRDIGDLKNKLNEVNQEQKQKLVRAPIASLLADPRAADTSILQNKRNLHPFIESLLRSPIPLDGRLFLSNLNSNVSNKIGAKVVSIDIIEQAFLLATNQIWRNAISMSSDVGPGPEDVHELYIEGYSFSRLPEGIIGSLYTRVRYVTITDNPGLDCIGSIVRQFPNLEALFIRRCPRISTLNPLRDMENNNLQQLAVSRCNLSENGTDWDGVMRALGSSKGPLRVLDFSSNDFTKFPKSVRLCGPTLERLHLAHNNQLDFLPEEIGRFPDLSLLDLRGDYELCGPAKSIERITDGACEVVHPYKGYGSAYWDLLHYWRGLVNLSILFRRCRDRLNERKRLLSSIPPTPSTLGEQLVPRFPTPSPLPATTNDHLKVVFLGGPNVGKSTIVNRLSANSRDGGRHRNEHHQSIGVDVRSCVLSCEGDLPNSGSLTKLSLWDFHQPTKEEVVDCCDGKCDQVAPQSIFFSPNTLYVIVWDMGVHNPNVLNYDDDSGYASSDDNDSCDDFSRMMASHDADKELIQDIDNNILYWVDCISNSGVEGCAVLPVASFNDKFGGVHGLGSAEAERRCDVMKEHLLAYFSKRASNKSLPSLHFGAFGDVVAEEGVLRVCSKNAAGIDKLKTAILDVTTKCPSISGHLSKKVSTLTLKTWDAVRALKEDHRKVISVDKLQPMIGQHDGNIADMVELHDSLRFLSSIGEVLYLGRSHYTSSQIDTFSSTLSGFVVLSPKWLACIVSCVLCKDIWSRLRGDWRFGSCLGKAWNISSEIPAISSEMLSFFWKSIPSVKRALSGDSTPELCSFLNGVLVDRGVFVPVHMSTRQPGLPGGCNRTSRESQTENSMSEVSGTSPSYFLIPGLFEARVPYNIWSYKSKKSWKATLAHSWLLPSTNPSRLMGRLAAAVVEDLFKRIQSYGNGCPLHVHHCFFWKSAFVLKLGMEVNCEHSGETKESVVDIFACMTPRNSPFCVASSPTENSKEKLVVSAKGQAGDDGRRIWDGGLALVVESAERVIQEVYSVEWNEAIRREVVCPNCLADFHCRRASSWGKDQLMESASKGSNLAHCSRGHPCSLSFLCGIKRHKSTSNNSSRERDSSNIVPKLSPSVVIVGLQDEKTQKITHAGSGFVVDKKLGLVVTAAHVLIDISPGENFGKKKPGRVVIGFISHPDTKKAEFQCFAEIVAKDICNVDGCVLRITSKYEKLQQLKLTRKCELNESIFLLGFNQGMRGLRRPPGSVNQHLDCSRGYVRMLPRSPPGIKDAFDSYSFVPRAEIIMGDCRVYSGHSGSPCFNQDGKVVGILSRADPADSRQSYIVPASELKHLVKQAKEFARAAREKLEEPEYCLHGVPGLDHCS